MVDLYNRPRPLSSSCGKQLDRVYMLASIYGRCQRRLAALISRSIDVYDQSSRLAAGELFSGGTES